MVVDESLLPLLEKFRDRAAVRHVIVVPMAAALRPACSTTKPCSPARRGACPTCPSRTSAPPRSCATPPAPPAGRRACSTRTGRWCSTRMATAMADSFAHPGERTPCSPSCRCSTPTPGGFPSPRRSPARSWSSPARTSTPQPLLELCHARAGHLQRRRPHRLARRPRGARRVPGRVRPLRAPDDRDRRRRGAASRWCAASRSGHGLRSITSWGMTEIGAGRNRRPAHARRRGAAGGRAARAPHEAGRAGRAARAARRGTSRATCRGTASTMGELEVRGAVRRLRLLPAGGGRRLVHGRRLVPHRRHRHDRPAGLPRDPRPHQGPHQVRRRVDQLGGARGRADGPPGGARRRRSSRCRTRAGSSGRSRRWCCARAGRPSRRSCCAHLAARFPNWWLPDDIVFVPAIPRTSTGKFLKSALRASLRGHYGRS